MLQIVRYQHQYRDAIATMIINIQQLEFQVPITLADQPDLMEIDTFYQQNNGEFWVAVNEQDEVVGSIALIDGGHFGTIRKMFVKAEYRGREYNIAQLLYTKLEEKALESGMTSLYLGTVERLKAAIRFYERNGFQLIDNATLPDSFPRMAVDTHFFKKDIA